MSHKRGAAKARLLLGVGYRPHAPRLLESDLRAQHLSLDVTRTSENAYGVVYEIEGPIKTPSGKTVRFCSIWQIDAGTIALGHAITHRARGTHCTGARKQRLDLRLRC